MQVSLNTRIEVDVAQKLKQMSQELDRSQASIVEEALKDWFGKIEKAGS